MDKLPTNLKQEWVTLLRLTSVYSAETWPIWCQRPPKSHSPWTQTWFVNAHATPPGVVTSVQPKREYRRSRRRLPAWSVEIRSFHKNEFRWKTARDHFLCGICLGKHGRKPNRFTARCDVQSCKMRSHPLLHRDSASSSTSATNLLTGSNNYESCRPNTSNLQLQKCSLDQRTLIAQPLNEYGKVA